MITYHWEMIGYVQERHFRPEDISKMKENRLKNYFMQTETKRWQR